MIRSGATRDDSESGESFKQRIAAAVARIRQSWSRSPRVAVILGTGLGDLADDVVADVRIPYQEIPGFPHSTALSHKSRLVCGMLDGTPVVTMQGRCHRYEGYSIDQLALPVHVMHQLGAGVLVVSNASGGMNPHYAAGDIMVLNDHVNLMWSTPVVPGSQAAGNGRPGRTQPRCYDEALVRLALRVARREQFVAHEGVYVAVTGPTYETRAEYRLFRRIGGDVVGMSTVPEVIAATQCGMRTLALSLVTNVAKPDAPDVVDAEEVVEAAAAAAPNMRKIVAELLRT